MKEEIITEETIVVNSTKEFKLYLQIGEELVDNGTVICTKEELQERFGSIPYKAFEVGVDELPEEDITISYKIDPKSRNNDLVHLTQEEIDVKVEKANAKIVQMQKAERAKKYSEITDPLLYDALEKLAEQFPEIFKEWMDAKVKIKEEESNIQ